MIKVIWFNDNPHKQLLSAKLDLFHLVTIKTI